MRSVATVTLTAVPEVGMYTVHRASQLMTVAEESRVSLGGAAPV